MTFGREIHDVRTGKLLGSKKGDKSGGDGDVGEDESMDQSEARTYAESLEDGTYAPDADTGYKRAVEDDSTIQIVPTGYGPVRLQVLSGDMVEVSNPQGGTQGTISRDGGLHVATNKRGAPIGDGHDSATSALDAIMDQADHPPIWKPPGPAKGKKALDDLIRAMPANRQGPPSAIGSDIEDWKRLNGLSTRRAVALGGKPVQFGREIHDVRSGKLLGSKKGDGGGESMAQSEARTYAESTEAMTYAPDGDAGYKRAVENSGSVQVVPSEEGPVRLQSMMDDMVNVTHATGREIGALDKQGQEYVFEHEAAQGPDGGDGMNMYTYTSPAKALDALLVYDKDNSPANAELSTRRAVALGGKPVQFGREIHDVRSGKLLGSKKGDKSGDESMAQSEARTYAESQEGMTYAPDANTGYERAVEIPESIQVVPSDGGPVRLQSMYDGAVEVSIPQAGTVGTIDREGHGYVATNELGDPIGGPEGPYSYGRAADALDGIMETGNIRPRSVKPSTPRQGPPPAIGSDIEDWTRENGFDGFVDPPLSTRRAVALGGSLPFGRPEQFGREIHDVRTGKLLGSKKGDKSDSVDWDIDADAQDLRSAIQASDKGILDSTRESSNAQTFLARIAHTEGPPKHNQLAEGLPYLEELLAQSEMRHPDLRGPEHEKLAVFVDNAKHSQENKDSDYGHFKKPKSSPGTEIPEPVREPTPPAKGQHVLDSDGDLRWISAEQIAKVNRPLSTRRAVALGGKPVQFGREIHDVRTGKLLGSKKGDGGGGGGESIGTGQGDAELKETADTILAQVEAEQIASGTHPEDAATIAMNAVSDMQNAVAFDRSAVPYTGERPSKGDKLSLTPQFQRDEFVEGPYVTVLRNDSGGTVVVPISDHEASVRIPSGRLVEVVERIAPIADFREQQDAVYQVTGIS